MGGVRIGVAHLVPNLGRSIVGYLVVLFGESLMSLGTLSYLGFGAQSPSSDWGLMVQEGQAAIVQGALLPALVPGTAIAAVVVAFNVVGVWAADRLGARRVAHRAERHAARHREPEPARRRPAPARGRHPPARPIRRTTGVALVFVGHGLSVVQHITDEPLVMRRGTVVEQGPTGRVLSAPEYPYTRLLLDSVPREGRDPAVARARAGA